MISPKQLNCLFLLLVFSLAVAAEAERLPLRLYTSADGLASGAIFHTYKDSRGFLWLSTRDGLSRFDGRDFVNYRIDEDYPPTVNATFETSDGTFWISAAGGIYRVRPDSVGKITEDTSDQTGLYRNFTSEHVSKDFYPPLFFEDSQGRLWGGGRQPVLISDNGELKLQEFNLGSIAQTDRGAAVNAIYEMPDGSLWFGCEQGALRLLPDGRRILYPIRRTTSYEETHSIISDDEGRVWVGHHSGVYIFQPETIAELVDAKDSSIRTSILEEKIIESSGSYSLPAKPGKTLRLRFAAPRVGNVSPAAIQTSNIGRIFKTFDGQIWVPAGGSLFVFVKDSVRRLSDTSGFPGTLRNFIEDAERNVWITTEGGALYFKRGGLTTWRGVDGLTDPQVHFFSAAPNGDFFAVHGDWRVSRLTENGIESAQLNLPDGDRFLWTSTAGLLDSSGDWWALTSGGLYRFEDKGNLKSPAAQIHAKKFGQKDGFKTDTFYAAFEDSQRNVWVSTRGTAEQNGLAQLDLKTNKWRFFSEADGFPNGAAVRAFAEDSYGNLWLGFYGGGFARFANNRFTDFSNDPEAPKGGILTIHTDVKGRLWLGSTRDGLSLVENPNAEKLVFKRFTFDVGLASNNIRSLTSDLAGNIYVGTVRGLDRLNPETGSVRHYSTADGLASDTVTAAHRDKNGALWFGTSNGMSRLEPGADEGLTQNNLHVLITNLQIAGKNYSVSPFGRGAVENLSLSAEENNLQIQFLSVGDNLRYQYKLENEGEKDWSAPTTERSVNFARLAPGDYKFFVRALDPDNRSSQKPAIVSFSIPPPFWRTWEFIGSMILITGIGVLLLDRYRVSKTRQVQNALTLSQAAEKASKESETRFRTLAETASDAIITIDEESRIVFVNPAVEHIFGYQTEELIGENLTMLMPKKMRNFHNEGFNRYLHTNRKNIGWNGIELSGRRKSGAEIPIEVSFGEFERDGRRYFTGIIRDISERRKAEFALQQAREDRLKELQRVRTRIATDLHDDIGSSLTQIAVLTEVARSQAILETVKTPLERISDVSGELVDAMADIVWAINPKKDSWRELVLRMRRFASDVLPARDIDFELVTPETDQNLQLGANIRREVFAIFKECVNNIVRHSGASEVTIEFEIILGVLRLKITDNGHGFDAEKVLGGEFTPDKGGNGLVNIRRRVFDLSGRCEINSSASGTCIELFVPLQKEFEPVSLAIRVDRGGAGGNNIH